MNNTSRLGGIVAATALVVAASAFANPADARGGLYDNCTNYNNRFPHGVGRAHAHDQTSGTPVTNFKHSNKLYRRAMEHNDDLDRDGDKIACESA